MPAELFRRAAPPRRRVSLVPLSVAAHAIGLATLLIAPILADAELPDPVRPTLAYVEVKVPSLPPLGKSARPHNSTKPTPISNERAAPTEAPDRIAPERELPDPGVGPDVGDLHGVGTGIPFGDPVADYVPPPPPPRAPVKVGGDIRQPRKIRDVPPRYPALAQQARVQGTVVIVAVIGTDGRVQETRVLHSVPLLDRAALDAVSQWVFSPTTLNGEAVPVVMNVTVEFRLQ